MIVIGKRGREWLRFRGERDEQVGGRYIGTVAGFVHSNELESRYNAMKRT